MLNIKYFILLNFQSKLPTFNFILIFPLIDLIHFYGLCTCFVLVLEILILFSFQQGFFYIFLKFSFYQVDQLNI